MLLRRHPLCGDPGLAPCLHCGSQDLWKLDLSTNKWEQLDLKNGPTARSGHRMVGSPLQPVSHQGPLLSPGPFLSGRRRHPQGCWSPPGAGEDLLATCRGTGPLPGGPVLMVTRSPLPGGPQTARLSHEYEKVGGTPSAVLTHAALLLCSACRPCTSTRLYCLGASMIHCGK